MNKKALCPIIILLFALAVSTFGTVYAAIEVDADFDYATGEGFTVVDEYRNINVTFTPVIGNLSASGIMLVDTPEGNFTLYPTEAVTLNVNVIGVSENSTDLTLYLNGVAQPYNVNISMTSTGTYYLRWITTAVSPTPTATAGYARSINTDYLWQYLYSYDIIGFIIACWTADLGESFYVIISMIVTLAFYIKLKNLTVMAVMWFILGFLWVGFIPIVSPIIFLLFIFGLASLIFKIYGESKY